MPFFEVCNIISIFCIDIFRSFMNNYRFLITPQEILLPSVPCMTTLRPRILLVLRSSNLMIESSKKTLVASVASTEMIDPRSPTSLFIISSLSLSIYQHSWTRIYKCFNFTLIISKKRCYEIWNRSIINLIQIKYLKGIGYFLIGQRLFQIWAITVSNDQKKW